MDLSSLAENVGDRPPATDESWFDGAPAGITASWNLPDVEGSASPAPVRISGAPAVVSGELSSRRGPRTADTGSSALEIREVADALASARQFMIEGDPTPTGELVRPFIREDSLGHGGELDSVPPPVSVDVFQRSVRARLKAEAEPSRTDSAGERSSESRVHRADSPWGATSGPTRRQLRAREKASNSTRAVAMRKLAKGGVLAVTALGVVTTTTPQSIQALGAAAATGSLTHNVAGFAGALSPSSPEVSLSTQQVALEQQFTQQRSLRLEVADAQADEAGNAAQGAGGALALLAKESDAAEESRRRAAMARAARDVARDPKAYAKTMMADYGWSGTQQFQCLDKLWTRESNWNYKAVNKSSGAYGIPQSLPGSKMASVADDWQTNPITQMKWGMNYIEDRYSTPCGAWAHSEATGWY